MKLALSATLMLDGIVITSHKAESTADILRYVENQPNTGQPVGIAAPW
jgi:hypothetical protein